ncbi:hypothetical protein EOPP23_11030 [Endozoicomonas sp. OPT23]|uniref:O-antigen ligase family protein n=1 Tax=Endozoicomonas sp. OPT23 TaxID=2072845 RepID=UPI00129A7B8B|nr:O-antigen ligase family protein [Endozoicomonas sp. OPT23]MRI33518.1 hypothetical protein [Endozoicomonas sp. OPT23]
MSQQFLLTHQVNMSNYQRLFFSLNFFILFVFSVLYTGENLPQFFLIFASCMLFVLFFLDRQFEKNISIKVMLFFVLYVFLNTVYSKTPGPSIYQAWNLVIIPIVFLAYRNAEEKIFNIALILVLMVSSVASINGLVEYFETFKRVDSVYLDANIFSSLMYLSCFITLFELYRQPKYLSYKIILYIFVFLFFCSFWAAYSRGGIASFLVGFILVTIFSYRYNDSLLKKIIFNFIFISLSSFFIIKFSPLIFGEDLLSRNFGISTESARWKLFSSAIEMIEINPFFGSGLGSFFLIYPQYRQETGSYGAYVHNDYLQFLVEGGFFLFLFLVFILLSHVWLIGKLFFRKIANTKLVILLASSFSLLVHASVNYIFYIPSLAVITGLILAGVYREIESLEVQNGKKDTLHSLYVFIFYFLIVVFGFRFVVSAGLTSIFDHKTSKEYYRNSQLIDISRIVDPNNLAVGHTIISHSSYALINENKKERRQSILDYSFDLFDEMIDANSYDPSLYFRKGNFISLCKKYELSCDQVASEEKLWLMTLEIDPGFLPAYVALSKISNKYGLIFLKKALIWVPSRSKSEIIAFLKRLVILSEGENEHDLYLKLYENYQDKKVTKFRKELKLLIEEI